MSPYAIAQSMSPRQYAQWYQNLSVPLFNGGVVAGVDCHEYRNNASNVSDHGTAAGQAAYDKLLTALKKHGLHGKRPDHFDLTGDAVTTGGLHLPFVGKGAPEDVILVLRLAHSVGLVAGIQSAMNDYCTRYLGTDCSGFVTNYLRHQGRADLSPANTGSTYYRTAGLQRRSVETFFATDVMALTQEGHVTIIDRIEPSVAAVDGMGQVVCWVAESAGSQLIKGNIHSDGIHYTRYTVTGPLKHTNFWFQAVRSGPEWSHSSNPNGSFKVVIRKNL